MIPAWLGCCLPAVVEHHAQGMNVGEVTLVGDALIAFNGAGLAGGAANVAESHGLLDESVDVAAEREPQARIELPDAVPGNGQQPLPIEPGVAVQPKPKVAKRLARGADPIAPLTTDPLE